jgi:hypothetical protein
MRIVSWNVNGIRACLDKYLQRLQLAHKWLNEHGGDTRKVWPMLMSAAKANDEPISEATARRYVNEAQRLFITFNPSGTRWTTEMLLNDALHMLHSAKNAGKHAEYARLLREAMKIVDKIDQYIREDAERIMTPIAIKAEMNPSLVPGFAADSNARRNAEAWLIERASKGKLTDAQIEPDE